MADPRLASILDQSGDAATVAWAHHGTGDLGKLADPELAIAAAAELGNVAVLQAVEQPKALRKAAAAALHRLKSKGVKVADVAPARSFTLTREQLNVPPRAWVGAPNAMGNCHYVLTATDFDGSCIMEVIQGGSKLQDQHGHAGRHELRTFWKGMEADRSLQEVPFVVGLHLADAAVRGNLVHGRVVHGWEHLLSKVAPGTVASARLVDPLRHALPESGTAFEAWVLPCWLIPAKVVDFTLSLMPGEGGAATEEGWLEQALETLLDAPTREAFALAAEQNALVYGVLGRGTNAAAATATAARLRAGGDANSFPELRSALLLATFQEMQRRQQEERQDLEAMMRKIGR